MVEADESDASFLNLLPVMAIVTNIDADHMDTYGHDVARLKSAFIEFTQRLPFYGSAVLCVDDANVREIMPFVSRPITTYGLNPEALVRGYEVQADGTRMRFNVQRTYMDTLLPPLQVELNLPGLHNVRNALAAIAVATEGVTDEAICEALAAFKGVGRRFTQTGEFAVPAAHGGGTFTVIDDYGHHPVEMAATLAARGAWPDRRIVLAFQPHRYTRTRDCFEDFVRVLGTADAVLLTEVYAAGEPPLVAADGRACRARAAGGGQGRTGVRGRRGGTAAGGPGFRAGRRRGDRDGRGVDQQGPGPRENWHERAIRQGGAVWRPFRRAGRRAAPAGFGAGGHGQDHDQARMAAEHGLPTPAFEVLDADTELRLVPDRLSLPLIIKPPHEGSTVGITKVAGYSDMKGAYEAAAKFDAEVLAEQFITGRELTALLGAGKTARALPVIEIAPGGNYDYEHKYFSDDTQYFCPADLPADVAAQVADIAVRAYRALGCEGWGGPISCWTAPISPGCWK